MKKTLLLAAGLVAAIASLSAQQILYVENFSNGLDGPRDEGPTGWFGGRSVGLPGNQLQIVPWYAEEPGQTPLPVVGINNNPAPGSSPLEQDHTVWTPVVENIAIFTNEISIPVWQVQNVQLHDLTGVPGGFNPPSTEHPVHLTFNVDGAFYRSEDPIYMSMKTNRWTVHDIDVKDITWLNAFTGLPQSFDRQGSLEGFGFFAPNTSGNWALDNVALLGIPEPSTLGLLGLGCAALLIAGRRRR